MFEVDTRTRVGAALVARAGRDPRITAAAVVGSLAGGGAGDRWSDLDLAFGVADGATVAEVVDDWSRVLASDFGATVLLDLHAGGAWYRVFLLPGCLQVDLSFAAGGRVLHGGPRFELLFGAARPMEPDSSSPDDRFGWGVLYARHAYVCLQRGRWWQAALCVTGVRDAAMDLACLARQLPAHFGRAYDDLPAGLLAGFQGAVAADVSPGELARALRAAIHCLIDQGVTVPWAATVTPDLLTLTEP